MLSTREMMLMPFDEVMLSRLQKRSSGRIRMFLFMLLKMPLGAFARLRVDRLDGEGCEVSLPAGWRTRNPFKSTYWAAQGMAAELSTGLGMYVHAQAAPVSIRTLVGKVSGEFVKPARSRVVFSCENLPDAVAALEETMRTQESVVCEMVSVGRDGDGDVISRWTFAWSFKASG